MVDGLEGLDLQQSRRAHLAVFGASFLYHISAFSLRYV
jgi:hypothetical protein